jgi:Tfp pilus assembly protein PilN
MKTLLNLLPEEKKDAAQRKLRFRFFLWQLFLVLVLECFYLIILIGIFFILNYQLDIYETLGSQLSTGSAEEKRLSGYEEKFLEANEQTDTIGRISASHLYFTEAFVLLDRLLPENTIIDRIATKDRTVALTGKAAHRDDLLALDANLKSDDCIENVNVPISNLFSESDIEFQVDFSIKDSCLRDR